MTESVSQNIYSGAKTLTRYKYDHEGNRVVKSSNYGEVVTPSAEISYRNDSIVTKHIFVSGVRVANKVCDEKSSNVYYQSVDHLGSTNILTDAKGNFYEHIETFPDGNIWVKEYVDQSGVNAVFTSHEMDVETKFFYAKARYYDAQLGRFISVNPIMNIYLSGKGGFGGIYNSKNLNLYHYCHNNPIVFKDPDGEKVKNIDAKTNKMALKAIQKVCGNGFYFKGNELKYNNKVDPGKGYSKQARSMLIVAINKPNKAAYMFFLSKEKLAYYSGRINAFFELGFARRVKNEPGNTIGLFLGENVKNEVYTENGKRTSVAKEVKKRFDVSLEHVIELGFIHEFLGHAVCDMGIKGYNSKTDVIKQVERPVTRELEWEVIRGNTSEPANLNPNYGIGTKFDIRKMDVVR